MISFHDRMVCRWTLKTSSQESSLHSGPTPLGRGFSEDAVAEDSVFAIMRPIKCRDRMLMVVALNNWRRARNQTDGSFGVGADFNKPSWNKPVWGYCICASYLKYYHHRLRLILFWTILYLEWLQYSICNVLINCEDDISQQILAILDFILVAWYPTA